MAIIMFTLRRITAMPEKGGKGVSEQEAHFKRGIHYENSRNSIKRSQMSCT